MSIRELDVVVLRSPLPEHGLERGDLGAVVAVYAADVFEVEFVRASGKAQAVVTLNLDQIRPVGADDIPSVRKQSAAQPEGLRHLEDSIAENEELGNRLAE